MLRVPGPARRHANRYAAACIERLIAPVVPKAQRLYLQQVRFGLLGWEPEARRLREYGPSGRIAVDAGANIGLWTYALATSGLFESVTAFEPNPALTKDLRSARLPNVTVVHKALSNKSGTRLLRIPRKNGMLLPGWASLEDTVDLDTRQFDELSVETARLDDEVGSGASFIKIDVEGHELALLEGARRFFVANRPTCLIECRENTRTEVARWFRDLQAGYTRVDTQQRYGFTLSPGNELYSRI
jgi:FkbM family methyltransferase